MRDAYPELWRLLTRKAEQSPAWRDFWKVWIIGFTSTMALLIILDHGVLSVGFGLVLVISGGATYVAGVLMRRLGIIRDYRPERGSVDD